MREPPGNLQTVLIYTCTLYQSCSLVFFKLSTATKTFTPVRWHPGPAKPVIKDAVADDSRSPRDVREGPPSEGPPLPAIATGLLNYADSRVGGLEAAKAACAK